MKTFYWSLVLMMLLPSMAYTQNTEKENEFSMSMQIRPRAEYRNGAWFPRNEGVKAASSINNRARLSIDYKRSDLEIKMSAQHVGVWGQDPQIDKNGRFVLNEAWAKLDFGHGLFAQLGRQALVYDDERILGAKPRKYSSTLIRAANSVRSSSTSVCTRNVSSAAKNIFRPRKIMKWPRKSIN